MRCVAQVLAVVIGWSGCAASVVDAQSAAPAVSANIRAANSRLAGALAEGMVRSPTFRSLVSVLDRSTVIVYLHEGRCERPAEACLMIAKTSGETRFVHINFRSAGTGPDVFLAHRDRLIAQIGHELQHAVEIANDREVVDSGSLSLLYDRIGTRRRRKGTTRYETEAAVLAGQQVLREVHEPRFRQARAR